MSINLIGLNSFFKSYLKESVHNNIPKKKFVWLIGAGMSVTSGIPVAQGVSDRITLLEYLDQNNLSKPWLESDQESHDFGEVDFFEELGGLSEGLYSVENLMKYFEWFQNEELKDELNDLLDSAYEWLKKTRGI